ncbi:MAG TPA: diguanylate cyclase [Miltoncostaea sp.]|nr:diguanylate cyclase [Miltoncostaea sp.]
MIEPGGGTPATGGALRSALAQTGALHRVARVVASGAEPAEVFRNVAQEVANLLDVDAGVVWRFDDGVAVAVGAWGDPGTRPGARFPLDGGGPVARVFETGRPARVHLDELSPEELAEIRSVRGRLRAGVAAPVRTGGRLWGAVLAASAAVPGLPADAEARLDDFADLVALAVANAEDRRAVERRIGEQTALRRVATAIAAGTPSDQMLGLICEEAVRLTGCQLAAVLRRRDEEAAEVVATWAVPGMPAPPEGHVIRLGAPGGPTAIRQERTTRLLPRPDEDGVLAAYHEGLAAPIALDGVPWGSLAIVSAEAPVGAEAERALLDLADLVRLAVGDAEQRRRIAEYAAEQSALRRAATLAASGAEPAEVLALVCQEAAQLLGLPSAAVVRLGDGRHSELVASWREDDGSEDPAGAWLAPGRAVASAPIVVGGEVWGVLAVTAGEGADVRPGAGERLRGLTEVAGIAVATAEAQRRSVEDAAAAIAAGGLDMTATLDAITSAAQRALGADRATVIVLPDGPGEPTLHTTEQDPALRGLLESESSGPDAREALDAVLTADDRVVVREHLQSAPEVRLGRLSGLRAFIAARLEHPSVGEGMLGALFIGFRQPRRFTARERAAVRSLMSISDLALANARLHARTLVTLADAEQRAASDPLTGLANHRAFHERLRDEVERARRHRRPLALALIDLDHFKDVNDRHGHQVGDEVLRETAARLLRRSRPEDLVARIGGEEFAWLLPESDALDAWKAAERAREAVAGEPFADGIPCTVSIGIAELSQATDAGDLVRLADGALYWAKGNGRNVSFCYSPEVVEVLSAEERAQSLERSQALNAIRALARAVDARDPSTRRHSERVAELSVRIAAELGWSPERQSMLREAALVHDVGKIGVADAVLFKASRLTDAEIAHIQEHSTLGAQIVADVLGAEQVTWVRSLHERFDGRGYPEGIRGERIPDGARVLAVADAWDAMTSARPYTAPLSAEKAAEECRREAGRQFDADVVAALDRVRASGRLPEGGSPTSR